MTLTADTWNDESLRIAWDPAEDANPLKAAHVSGSKVAGEKAVWEFAAMSEKKDLVVNSVVPNINCGPLLDVRQKASSGSFIPSIYEHGLDALILPDDLQVCHLLIVESN